MSRLRLLPRRSRCSPDGPSQAAVNAPLIDPESLEAVGPYLAVAEMCGRLATQLASGQWRDIIIRYQGEIASHDVTPLKASVVAGLLAPILRRAREPGQHQQRDRASWLAHCGAQVAGRPSRTRRRSPWSCGTSAGQTSLMGTLEHGRAAVVEINGFHVHISGPRLRPGEAADHLHLLVLRNEDRPGTNRRSGHGAGAASMSTSARWTWASARTIRRRCRSWR